MKDLIGMGQNIISKNKEIDAKKMFGVVQEAKREDTDPSVGDRNEVTEANKAHGMKSRVQVDDDDSIEAGSINDEAGAHKAARELK